MTREQAEKEIRDAFTEVWADGIIKALEQEPKNEVLDKIKEDIQFIKDKCLPNTIAEEYEQKGLQEALDIIDKYKAESEVDNEKTD